MAIAFVRTTTSVNPASDTLAFDATATNGYLVVQTLIQSSQTCSGVTYNGVAMTQLTTLAGAPNAGETLYLWGLAAPTTGTNNIVGSFSGAGTRVFDAILYSGAQTATAIEASNTTSGGAATSASISVTTITDNDWLVGYFRGNGGGAFTAGSNTVVRTAGAEGTRQLVDTGAAQTPAGSKSLNVTMGSQAWSALAFALKPTPPATFKTWNGVAIASIKSINGVS